MKLEILKRRYKWMLTFLSSLYFRSPHCKREIKCLCFEDIIDSVASKAWTQCKIWNPTLDLVACFRFYVKERERERERESTYRIWVRILGWEIQARNKVWAEKKLRNSFRWESLTEGTSISNMEEVYLRWNWYVILIDVAILNWVK